MNNVSHRSVTKNLWYILFQFPGSIWCSVLPYCFLNCFIMVGVEMLAYYDIKIAFSPSGHGLMTLIISYLVVAKVNLSYDRYMNARHAIGHALASLRELNQISMTYTSRTNDVARQWRSEGTFKIIDLMDCTIRVIQDEKQAVFLARNEFSECKKKSADDPMLHVQALRLHLYKGCYVLEHPLELLEKMKLVDMLNEYVIHYRDLLKLASTPLPFPLLQMARTFLFLYTFTIPFVLRGVVDEAFVAMIFVFFLTYGFVGLELVAMKLMYPFGDGVNDLNVTGMRDATIFGIENDLQLFGEATALDDRRMEFKRQKPRPPSVNQDWDDAAPTSGSNPDHNQSSTHDMNTYHAMTHA